MDSPSCHRRLRRFWFRTEPGPGIGVTALSEEEARRLAEATLEWLGPAEIVEIVADVDVRTLDPGHVLPNMGPAVVRGVWYPRLNL